MGLWELTIRHPDKVRNVRIPSPFTAYTAVCHVQEQFIVEAGTGGFKGF